MEEYPQHPEWSEKYPAIDGIKRSPSFSRYDETVEADIYTSDKAPIRSDIEKILLMNSSDFNKWLSQRREATEEMIEKYKLFSSIPNLRYDSGTEDMSAYSHVRGHLSTLEEGLDYLEKIKQLYAEIHSS